MGTKNHNQVVSEIQSDTIFFCHLGPLFSLYPLPPTPPDPTPQKTKILKKKKKASGDVIILNLCNKKQSNDVCILRYGV